VAGVDLPAELLGWIELTLSTGGLMQR